mmetsp:Transcript_2133/g.8281  ORF Transcript_2133/g.8281 Transcript_2133/m.8281 type:complete len:207 (+) Transcript_2133:558-1178(+)
MPAPSGTSSAPTPPSASAPLWTSSSPGLPTPWRPSPARGWRARSPSTPRRASPQCSLRGLTRRGSCPRAWRCLPPGRLTRRLPPCRTCAPSWCPPRRGRLALRTPAWLAWSSSAPGCTRTQQPPPRRSQSPGATLPALPSATQAPQTGPPRPARRPRTGPAVSPRMPSRPAPRPSSGRGPLCTCRRRPSWSSWRCSPASSAKSRRA